jgi:hypothetical protein
MKRPFLVHLRSMNVTAGALFPGLDGLGRSLAESASIAGSIPNAMLVDDASPKSADSATGSTSTVHNGE